MTRLSDIVEINRRFARSARIDADLKGTPPLVGYVLQASVAKSLETMASSQIDSRQGAFTWTGPYGGGKSSAALLVANLVAGGKVNRRIARDIAGEALTGLFAEAFPETRGGWGIVAVTGSRVRLRDALADAAAAAFGWSDGAIEAAKAADEMLITALLGAAAAKSGVFLILDELGKMLEHEALEGGDVHLLQDLAERASRSDGRLVVVGILHQSFDQYAARAARDARQEWAKVQGRFQDIAFLSGADETVALLGRAVATDFLPPSAHVRAAAVAEAVARRRPTETALLAQALADAWPLNPVTALLLGPVSRQRFAQNERSVFGFLSSAEPSGFQEFLSSNELGATYDPARLWDYLASNFGMALAAGADGSRFSLAFEAIERAGAKGGPVHVAITKAAAVIEFFRNGSGLAVADDFIEEAVPDADSAAIRKAIGDLLEWAVLIRQPRLGGYALFAGSDFDLEDAIGRATAPVDAASVATIPQRAGFGFATAKRHYFSTGALRTFDVVLQLVGPDDDAGGIAARIAARQIKGSGQLVLLLGDGHVDRKAVDALAKSVAKALNRAEVIAAIAGSGDSFALRSITAELLAVERVLRDHPQLEGDRIARREIAARQSACIDQLHRTLEQTLDSARWFLAPEPSRHIIEPLAVVASALADEGFPKAPILKSELLQRDRPSSNANAALRDLCHAMVRRPGEADLGMSGFPAELGLYLTVLKPFGLHRPTADGSFDFFAPDDSEAGRSLLPAWVTLETDGDLALDAIYARWASPPFGIKSGVMPALILSYLMANRDRVAVYIDDVFQTSLDDFLVDKLLQKPDLFRLRHIDRSVRETAFLSGLARLFEVADVGGSMPVAQALFQRFERLTDYAQRTQTLGEDALSLRSVVLRASDPERLLFDDLPDAFGDRLSAELVFAGLQEAEASYPSLLERMRLSLARALGVDAITFSGVAERAASIRDLTNDYNLEAFAMRAAAFENGGGDVEGLISLLVHKPATAWSDRDREQALSDLAQFGRRFRELEALAVVRDRRSQTEALALVVGVDPSIPPLLQSFVLTEQEKVAAAALADRVLEVLGGDADMGHLRLAALARAVASLAADGAERERNVA
ncbi:hypothetical protein [Sphingopyxis sp. R3-92]|uniref:hypothetical protein n=1 Tax=Sphingopyxis sp. R3-92 TaxID=3158553 RepID=UPI003EE6F117